MRTCSAHEENGADWNVPDGLHRKLKGRAAQAGQTLSDTCWRNSNDWPRDEMLTRIRGQKRVTLKTPAAVAIREERESA